MSLKLRNLQLRQGIEDPCPREGHTLTYISSLNSLLLFGGQSDQRLNDLHFLDLKTLQWCKQNSTGQAPLMRCYHTAFYDDQLDYFFIYGGEGDKGRSYEDIYCLQLKTLVWKKFFLNQSSSRHQHTLCDMQNDQKELIVFGGISLPQNKLLNDVWIFNYQNIDLNQSLQPATGMSCHPKQTKGDLPSPRRGHQAFVHQNFMYIFGGKCKDQKHDDFSIYQLDLKSFLWKKIQTIGQSPTPRSFFSLNYIDETRIIIFGGQENKTNNSLNEIYQLNLEDFYWSQPFLGDIKIEPRYNHSYVTFPYINQPAIGIMGGISHNLIDMKLYIFLEDKTNTINFKIDQSSNYFSTNSSMKANELDKYESGKSQSLKSQESNTHNKNNQNEINFNIEKYIGQGFDKLNNNNMINKNKPSANQNEINFNIQSFIGKGFEKQNNQQINQNHNQNEINFNIDSYLTNPINPIQKDTQGITNKNPFHMNQLEDKEEQLNLQINELDQEIQELEQLIKQEEEIGIQMDSEMNQMQTHLEQENNNDGFGQNNQMQLLNQQIQMLDNEYYSLTQDLANFFFLYNQEKEYSKTVQGIIQKFEPLLQGQSQYTMSLDSLFQLLINDAEPQDEQELNLQELLQPYKETSIQQKEEQKGNFINLKNIYLQINTSVNLCDDQIENLRKEALGINKHFEKFFLDTENNTEDNSD
ncbi:hypothetical protein ABPG74_001077 [Tetrahymena malaccensis]